METDHDVHVGDARSMTAVADDAVELVVTSPPYPMIEMWDDVFADMDPAVEDCLAAGDGEAAFRRMHDALGEVWDEVARVLAPGGVACVNVGDATRSVGDRFRLFPNHTAVVDAFRDRDFRQLPGVLWRKPTNSASKFLGSGMLPTNAHVTLEHEHVLVFRNGPKRDFEAGAERRYESAYFWEERNEWFSDVWTDVQGTFQALDHGDLRERSGAFPMEIPYRLVNMYSVYGDTVLDPFWGTGTTSLAAMVAGRSSVGYELRAEFTGVFDERVAGVCELARETARKRLQRHREFVRERTAAGDPPEYEATHYDVPVVTSQERDLRLYVVEEVRERADGYTLVHRPFEPGRARGGGAAESPAVPDEE